MGSSLQFSNQVIPWPLTAAGAVSSFRFNSGGNGQSFTGPGCWEHFPAFQCGICPQGRVCTATAVQAHTVQQEVLEQIKSASAGTQPCHMTSPTCPCSHKGPACSCAECARHLVQ